MRRLIVITGVVQGVGFRPFVHGLAVRLGLAGFVRNDGGEVVVEIEGEASVLDQFVVEVTTGPPLSRIETVRASEVPSRGETEFRIETSMANGGAVRVSPDVATCADCVRELFDPADRRYRYPFINCTNCGPRLTIVRSAPYDRERTTMAGFAMCAACRAEFEDPADRRFHAQPVACAECGPRVTARPPHPPTPSPPRGEGERGGAGEDRRHSGGFVFDFLPLSPLLPLGERGLGGEGRILAIKGLGGYHLACRADDESAVAELRRRKHRSDKPFAVMVADLPTARQLADISPAEADLLESPAAPVVLVRRRADAAIAPSVAPGGNPLLGLVLPYTPLHHLLMRHLDGVPLVMTSGNRSDEPIAFTDEDALARLGDIADAFLTHDRPIHLRCDDSVMRIVDGVELPYRRSRGYAPSPLPLPVECRVPILAVGGQQKSTFALGFNRHATLSHHLGDLDHLAAYEAFVEAISHYERLFDVRPEVIAHDLHPDYASTRYATQRGIRLVGVQHHHAHLAACLAEHGQAGPAIGVTFDGSGYGGDGTVWGGEWLVGDCRSVRRVAHLRQVRMPGGEQAVRQPWRMAVAQRVDIGEPEDSPELIVRLIARGGLLAPLTSSVGRLFDAVASLVGLRHVADTEGQAAVELEWAALTAPPDGEYPFAITDDEPIQVDTRPLIAAIVADVRAGVPAAVIARRFHDTLAGIIVAVCVRIRERTGLGVVALSGGVFLNALLLTEVVRRLERERFAVLRHRQVPPSDGGLSLGQLAVAATIMSRTG